MNGAVARIEEIECCLREYVARERGVPPCDVTTDTRIITDSESLGFLEVAMLVNERFGIDIAAPRTFFGVTLEIHRDKTICPASMTALEVRFPFMRTRALPERAQYPDLEALITVGVLARIIERLMSQ